MVQRAWASLGVAVFLGVVGCSPQQEGDAGAAVDSPPGEVTPVDDGPAPAVDPDPPQEVPPPVVQEDLCAPVDPGTMLAEDLISGRPDDILCQVSPDGCDALRASHARRAIPRPCHVWNTTEWSNMRYRLEHDALGRLTSFEGPGDGWEGFTYDACHRLTGHSTSPSWSMRYFDEAWTRTASGQLEKRRFLESQLVSDMTVERDERGWPVSATVTPTYLGMQLPPVRHHFTLDAEGRIEWAEGRSFDFNGSWREHAWLEVRHYDAAGTLVEVQRSSNGKLLWMKGLSQGRLVRHVTQEGLREQRWTYGTAGELLRVETDSRDSETRTLKQQYQVEFAYGEDGRLLRVTKTTRTLNDAGWTESQHFSEYRYAEDGRILSREDFTRSRPTSNYLYEYVCEPDPETGEYMPGQP